MRKILLIMFVILVLSVMSIAAAGADGNSPVLLSSDYIEGKGVVLKIEGDIASLEKTLAVGDTLYDLDCKKDDEGVWTCVAFVPKQAFGETAAFQLGDFSFEFTVREPHPAPPPPPPPAPPNEVCLVRHPQPVNSTEKGDFAVFAGFIPVCKD